MKENFSKKIELFANIAIIVVAVTLTFVLAKKFVFSQAAPTAASKETIAVGGKLDLPSVDWDANQRTLVLVISTECHYCHESLPFYRKLSAAAQSAGVALVTVFPQEVAAGTEYLKTNEVPVSRVIQANPPNLGIGGTPTLLLIDRSGVVTDSWFGKLVADQEKQVFERLAETGGLKDAG